MKTIHWGILGTGRIAEKFAIGLQHVTNAQLYAVGSRTKEQAIQFASRYNIPRAYGSYAELAADPNVDVIYIASPHVFHAEHTLLCLEAGKAVLCEKPFAMNARQVSDMIKKAKEKDLFLMEALWTRFLPTVRHTEQLIASGVIGDIIQIQSDFGFKAEYDPQWRLFNKQLGGGSLLDIGIYPVFIALLLLGMPDEIVSSAVIGKTGIDESIGAIFKYNNGKIASLTSTFMANTPTETIISGTEGRIRFHRMWHMPTFLTLTKNDGTSEDIRFNYAANGYEYEAQEVTNCLLQGLKESPLLPLSFSEKLISLLDTIRGQWNLEYD
ncbi:MAG: Gfo/Idh/MocA family oxidoreductase [Bacteroidales bacterium]|nr:Gfo/Idh/MocA family oxidoreductase [Bacteroidales bacterium]HOK97923.1 Gfo/Idh/MocA family oxidoreductase [Bacteroidales bacterium]HPO64499.1 Gfo/Idh/MocA family oxidoreductase [Bacteroidales bacterium]